ncbi:MAG: valine--pyruvate transaminase [Pseudomonadota bacterium]
MNLRFSEFGQRLTGPTGTRSLMDDLGEVMASSREWRNLGGGNPAAIKPMEDVFSELLDTMRKTADFTSVAGNYDSPQGALPFRKALAKLLKQRFGWPITERNVVVTAGGQMSFFLLFNLFAGRGADGVERAVHLPITPEYIGYADLCLAPQGVVAHLPRVEYLDEVFFKYRIDFDALALGEQAGAVCVSRPTNPTGNVITDSELAALVERTRALEVPLIVDNAYGVPFPQIVFDDVEPLWEAHVVYCLSLSKLGLPGLRSGIVIANEEICDALTSMNAICYLAPSAFGVSLVTPLVESGRILELSQQVIAPFYRQKVAQTIQWCHKYFKGLNYRIHQPGGAIFLWLWFPELSCSSRELYERLKAKDVIVLSGEYFFPGIDEPPDYAHQCLRISYAQSGEAVEYGIQRIAEEIRQLAA